MESGIKNVVLGLVLDIALERMCENVRKKNRNDYGKWY